jgi:hypothetical protein
VYRAIAEAIAAEAAGGAPLEPRSGKRNLIDLISTIAYGIGADRHPVSLGELHAAYLRAYPGVGKGISRASFDATINYHCINMRSRFPDARNRHRSAYWLTRPVFKRVARARYMLLSEEDLARFRCHVAADDPLVFADEFDVADLARCEP